MPHVPVGENAFPARLRGAWAASADIDDVLAALNEAGSQPSLASAVAILPLLMFRGRTVRDVARRNLSSVLRALHSYELASLDAVIRAQQYTFHNLSAEHLVKGSEDDVDLWGIAAMVRNGFEREAAVRRLSEFADGRAVAWLLIRTHDPVEEVRSAAMDAASRLIESLPASALLDHLALADRLASWERGYGAETVARLKQRLTSPDLVPILREQVASRQPLVVRRSALRQLISIEDHDSETMLAVTADPDPVLQRLGVEMLAHVAGDEAYGLMTSVLGARRAEVRRAILTAMWDRFPAEAIARARVLMFDRSSGVRSLAAWIVRKGGDEPRLIYLRTIRDSESPNDESGVLGLADVANADDLDYFRDLLSSHSPALRRAACRVVGRLGGEEAPRLLLDRLGDESSSVSRAARQSLERRHSYVSAGPLWQLVLDGPEHARRNAIALLQSTDRWEWIIRSLNALQASRTREIGLSLTALWLQRVTSPAPPTGGQRSQLAEALAEARTLIGEKLFREIQHAVAPFLGG